MLLSWSNVQCWLFPGGDFELGLPRASDPPESSSSKGSTKPPVEGTKTDKMEESLTCVICQDLLHDCVR